MMNLKHINNPYLATFFVILVIALAFGIFLADRNSKDRIFGQQFVESDLEGTTGITKRIVVACDKTEIVVPDLIADNFVPENVTEFTDVQNDIFRVTFWKRKSSTGDVHIITQSHVGNGVTCILSVSKNINNLQPSESVEENDRKPSVNDSDFQFT